MASERQALREQCQIFHELRVHASASSSRLASSDEEDEDEDDDEGSLRLPTVPGFNKGDSGPQRKKQRLTNKLPTDGTSGEGYDEH